MGSAPAESRQQLLWCVCKMLRIVRQAAHACLPSVYVTGGRGSFPRAGRRTQDARPVLGAAVLATPCSGGTRGPARLRAHRRRPRGRRGHTATPAGLAAARCTSAPRRPGRASWGPRAPAGTYLCLAVAAGEAQGEIHREAQGVSLPAARVRPGLEKNVGFEKGLSGPGLTGPRWRQ